MPEINIPKSESAEASTSHNVFNFVSQSLIQEAGRRKSRLFPADELGIPLSIYIPETYRSQMEVLDRDFVLDKHHRFAPRRRLIHKEGNMGKILRYSCLQIVPQELHVRFNGHFDEPLLPSTNPEKFGGALISIARYLPLEAIDVSQGEPIRRELLFNERQLIWANNELRPEQVSKVQREILKYIANRNIIGVDEGLVEEFITTSDSNIRLQRGKELFRIAAEVAVEPIEKAYTDAWESGLLPRQDIRPQNGRLADLVQARAVPKSLKKFIARHVVKNDYALHRPLDLLYDNLLARYAT